MARDEKEIRDERITVRLTKTEHTALVSSAKRERRSWADQVRVLAMAGLRHREERATAASFAEALLRDEQIDLPEVVAELLHRRPELIGEVILRSREIDLPLVIAEFLRRRPELAGQVVEALR